MNKWIQQAEKKHEKALDRYNSASDYLNEVANEHSEALDILDNTAHDLHTLKKVFDFYEEFSHLRAPGVYMVVVGDQ